MPNPIKYSTGSETLALKKGDFYIGTGDVGKGPTSTTGYYNGIEPPSGGYTIYLNKATGGPSIYTCTNDSSLISITNSIAGESYTTVNECLTYFAGQTDKIVLNRNYEGIVTNGLVVDIDAGFTPSYPKNGTTSYDISINTNNGTLTNGPTFSSNDGGSFSFDGTNDYIDCGNASSVNIVDNVSVNVWFKLSILDSAWRGIVAKRIRDTGFTNYAFNINGGGAANRLQWYYNSGSGYRVLSATVSGNFTTGVWYNVCGVFEKSGSSTLAYIYKNGSLLSSSTLSNNVTTFNPNLRIGSSYVDGEFFNGNIAIVQVYNRALTSSETLQNYNAQKGRFGL